MNLDHRPSPLHCSKTADDGPNSAASQLLDCPQAKQSSMPNLPFEVIRRIIHHRLALPDSVPQAIPTTDFLASQVRSSQRKQQKQQNSKWDDLAGHAGRQAAKARLEERREVVRDASGMMLVCKAWKPIVMRYLYHSPPLTSSSLLLLTESVLRGDKKWDDTRLHPHSIPGRYVRMLDLSGISLSMTDFGYDFDDPPLASTSTTAAAGARVRGPAPHVTALARACAALMPLLPNVTHVRMPEVGGGAGYEAILRTIRRAPFLGKLRAVEGLHVPGGTVHFVPVTGDDSLPRMEWREGQALIHMLSAMPDVEYLSFAGTGLGADTWDDLPDNHPHSFADPSSLLCSLPTLHLPKLHTLRVDSLPTSPLLAILASSPLPSLSRLLLTSYTPLPLDHPALASLRACPDLSSDMLAAHGSKLQSLTFLPTREWPPVHPLPPDEVFERYCPNVRHVSLMLPLAAYVAEKEGAARLGSVMGRRGSKVECVTLAKWAQRSGGSPSPSPHVALAGLPMGAGDPGIDMDGLGIHDAPSSTSHGQQGGRKLPPLPRTHPFLHALVSTSFQATKQTCQGAAPSTSSSHATESKTDRRASPADHRATGLRSIMIDGLTSVSPHLSFAARDAGANGEMRAWACGIASRGIEMLDGAGGLVLKEYQHILPGVSETFRPVSNTNAGLGPGMGTPTAPPSHSYTDGIISGSIGARNIGSWGDMSPIATAAAAGALGMRRSSAGEWDNRGRRRSRGGAGAAATGGMSIFGGYHGAGAAETRDRGRDDEDGG